MNRAPLVLVGALLASALPACSVEFLADQATDAISNTCKVDADCSTNATCTEGACFAKSGVIDEVLLEIVPESNSFAGDLSFLSMLSGIRQGSRDQKLALPARVSVVTQVITSGDELPATCPYAATTSKPTIQARIEFTRTGAVGGVPIFGLGNVPTIVDTALSSGSWAGQVWLLPGTYDIYIQPSSQSECGFAPRILRGIEVPGMQGWAPPATLELSKPAALAGKVTRGAGGTLEGWQVDIIDPQEGRVISTTARLGAAATTNFALKYQPLAPAPAASAPSNGPLIRISPPPASANEVPTIYWDLAAAALNDVNGVGQCNLDMSGLRDPSSLITVSGQVHGKIDDAGVQANVQFHSLSLEGAAGLTAAFKQSITSDEYGRYSARLYPGQYRVVIIPVATDAPILPSTTGSTPMPSGAATRPWAIAEEQWTITAEPTQTLGFVLPAKRVVEGNAYAGTAGMVPALGATLEAIPVITPSQVGPLKGALAQAPVVPQNASVSVDDGGKFSLRLDPGDFDLSLRTPESSNLAWWVWPGAHVTRAQGDRDKDKIPIDVARLPYPVPLEGEITAPDVMGHMLPLRGAAVRAYARVPAGGGVTKVGDARTDDMGRYRLRLPPTFGP